MPYCLPDNYTPQVPAVYIEIGDDTRWQADVYTFAAEVAYRNGSQKLIDFGCSTAGKLRALSDRFEIIGIDAEVPNSDDGQWIRFNLDSTRKLPLDIEDLDGSTMICADVIEHLRRPERLVKRLREALALADALVISTPDRDRVRGPNDLGPPANECHAREWAASEFVEWLTSEGLNVTSQTWQAAYQGAPDQTTTVVICDARNDN